MLALKLAWLQTLSLWRAGAMKVLVVSLVLAVAAITAVSFFTQRVESALNQQGGLLLGGDISVQADHPIPDHFLKDAATQNIHAVRTYEFASMVIHGDTSQLAEIKAVESGFPMRGDLTIGSNVNAVGRVALSGPKPGEVWVEPRLANLLGVKSGDALDVGELRLVVGAILLREPSRGGDMFGFAPRLMMHADDLPATQLIQYGSRVKYQLLLASDPESIQSYMLRMAPKLARGERIQDVRNARPEIKSALDKAQQFLGLSAMISVILAMVAMLLSSFPYIKQSLNTFALMRCFGAQQHTVIRILTIQTGMIAALSAVIGVSLGMLAQAGLAKLAGHLFLESLPAIPLTPVFIGFLVAMAMMIAVVVPHAWQMRKLSTMNILRRDTLVQPLSAQAKYLPAAIVMFAMILWQAHDIKIAASTIAAILAIGVIVLGVVYLFVYMLNRFVVPSPQSVSLSAISLGLMGIKRRLGLSVIQIIGFCIGLMVIILLALIRGDLIRNWQASLPANAPNRFVINIQPLQVKEINQFLLEHEIDQSSTRLIDRDTRIFPMVRGRLVSINGKAIKVDQWRDERAKRLAEREFNLSWAAAMQSDNKLVAGRWWKLNEKGVPLLSLEEGLANTLGIRLGDQLVFDVAGNTLKLTVASLRKVEWDTMRVNFFAVTPPGVLDQYPASYISSFYLPIGADAALNSLVKQYPNLTVIDVATLMQQVRGIMQKMTDAIEYVFMFSLLVGAAVLYAALVATRDERLTEVTLLRVFGASKKQVSIAYIAEFASIGLIAALVATAAANLLAYYLSVSILNIPFQFNVTLSVSVLLISAAAIPLAAWFGLRRFLNTPPRQLLYSI